MTAEHRLEGLEPDNLLAFLALLGLLRVLEAARPDWAPRVRWDVDAPPTRPVLVLRGEATTKAIAEAAADGVAALGEVHDFGDQRDLTLSREAARQALGDAVAEGGYRAELWAALTSDAAEQEGRGRTEPTPLCLIFGQGHQHFLDRLGSVARTPAPPPRGRGRKAVTLSAAETLAEAVFEPWTRPDATFSFRWDPAEDVRYALRPNDPTDTKTKETTQHGANRLATVGLSALTVTPERRRGEVRLGVLGGERDARGAFSMIWPIWRAALGLDAIRALLSHPDLASEDARLGVVERRRARRISAGKFMNMTRAEVVREGAAEPLP